ncbi:MAG: sigma 54-interacting transcriptional regulator [Lachnospirales bacterium]
MLLARIKGALSKFANTISKTLDVDVLIVDSNLKVVGSTFRYFDQYEVIRRVSIIGQCISTREVVAIEDRRKFGTCQACPEYETCEMRGLIAVPIFYRDTVVGAIALIIPQQKVANIFRDVNNSVEFLQNMSALLSSKLQDSDDYSALDVIKQEREILMDEVGYAIVSTDNLGVINYHNKRFSEYFRQEKNCVGKPIYEFVPHRVITDFLSRQVRAENQLIFIDNGTGSFYGLATCSDIVIRGQHTGALFIFKPVSQINSDFSEIVRPDTKATFARYEEQTFPRAVTDEAKRLAVGGQTVLIQSAPGAGEKLLARCIHNYSDRSHLSLVTVDCGYARDLREQIIFGELGQLHLAHGGTVYFQNVELLPYYLQEKLVDFLRGGVLNHENGGQVRVDVRVICSTTADLRAMTEAGTFLEPLYYRISERTLTIPPIREDPEQLRRMIENGIRFYRSCYHKPELTLSSRALERLCRWDWPGNLTELDQALDQLVHRAEQEITADSLEQLPAFSRQKVLSVEEMERERIGELLRQRYSKEEIARLLGISRATLYRKIKQYQFL